MNREQIKVALSHLYMVRASLKTMLTNVQEITGEDEQNELLDQLILYNEEIERLEKLIKL